MVVIISPTTSHFFFSLFYANSCLPRSISKHSSGARLVQVIEGALLFIIGHLKFGNELSLMFLELLSSLIHLLGLLILVFHPILVLISCVALVDFLGPSRRALGFIFAGLHFHVGSLVRRYNCILVLRY